MPTAPPKPCSHPGCAALVRGGSRCPTHARQREANRQKRVDAQRPSAQARGYDSRWQKARRGYLVKHPLCVKCKDDGKLVPATVVDHIKPHKGDRGLFWDSGNWQALCKPCHDRKTATEDGGWGKRLPSDRANGYRTVGGVGAISVRGRV